MQRRNRCCFRVSEDIFVVCVLTGAVRLDSNGEMCPPLLGSKLVDPPTWEQGPLLPARRWPHAKMSHQATGG